MLRQPTSIAAISWLILVAITPAAAFVTPTLVCHSMTTSTATTPLQALPPSLSVLQDGINTHAIATSMILSADENISLDESFQDSISFTDGPAGLLLAAFAVFCVLAAGLKAVMSQMDSAIEQVLRDFECSLKQFYPQRWEAIAEKDLVGLEGDERDIQLLRVMEQIQRDEPEFMTKLANRS